MRDDFPVHGLLVQSRARQLMLLEPLDCSRALMDLETRDPEAAAKVKAAVIAMGRVLPVVYRPTSPQNLWSLYHRDLKLRAIDFKFYQAQSWAVQPGDIYCLTRYGTALFRVVEFGQQSILVDTVVSDEGVDPFAQEWDEEEFKHGGFAEHRVHVPRWIWDAVAKEHLMQVDWALLNTENKN